MHARRCEAQHHVAGGDVGARQKRAALGRADREAREVVVARLIEARHLGGLAADQGTFRLPAAFGYALDDRRAHLGLELSTGEVVEEEERLGALHDEIVDRHGHKVDADRLVPAGLDRDLDLGADPVGRRHQHRIDKSRPLEIEQAAESPDFGVGAGTRGRAHQRLDQLHHAVPGIDIDTGLGIGEALFGHVASFAVRGVSVLGILRVCNGLLVSRFRSSHHSAAASPANFGIEGH